MLVLLLGAKRVSSFLHSRWGECGNIAAFHTPCLNILREHAKTSILHPHSYSFSFICLCLCFSLPPSPSPSLSLPLLFCRLCWAPFASCCTWRDCQLLRFPRGWLGNAIHGRDRLHGLQRGPQRGRLSPLPRLYRQDTQPGGPESWSPEF